MKLVLIESYVLLGSLLLFSLKAKLNAYLSIAENEIKVSIHNCILELQKIQKSFLKIPSLLLNGTFSFKI